MEGPVSKGEESSKKVPATSLSPSGRRGKEVSVNVVNTAHQGGGAQPRPRRQYPTLPVPLSHIYRQIRDKVSTTAPGPSFDPTIQDQSKQCEYHRGAPGHTLDNCWKLRERIQEMIDAKELVFNAVRSPNVQANPLPDHGPAQGPSINMITVCTSREGEGDQGWPSPFVIEYVPAEAAVRFTGIDAPPAPLVIDIPTREPYSDDRVPWTYEGGVGNLEQQFGVMGITRSGRLYENSATTDKGKAPATEVEARPRAPSTPPKKVTEEEAEAFMKIIKMAKSPTHISLLALLLNSKPHKEALLRVLMAAQVPKGTPPDQIEETVNSIFSNTISFSDNELPSEGCTHSRALHIVCKCNNHIVGRVMIDNGSALNRHIPSIGYPKRLQPTTRKALDPLGRRHSVLTTSKGKVLLCHNYIPGTGLGARGQGISRSIEVEEYKHRRGLSFRPSCHEIIEARRGIHLHRLATHYGRLNRGTPVPPLSHFFPGPPLIIGSTSDGPSSDFNDMTDALPTVYAVTEEIPSEIHIRPAQENEELNNWTSVLCYSAVIADVLHSNPNLLSRLHSNPNLRHVDSKPSEECLGEPGPIYFGEELDKDSLVPEIEESLRRLEGRQLTSLEPTEEINVGTEEEPRILKIGKSLDQTQRARMIDFLSSFSKYNQIRMAEEDRIKTTFTTMWGTFCYRVMPFGLKNTGATYQRAMVILFHDMMHKEVERLFDRLKEYKLRLNPVKCTFGARSGKLLGFVVSERGIEVDPDKVKAIKELPPPSSVCEEEESTHTERAIYYLSKKFTDGESNYPEIEKMCCALVWVMQRLRQYTLYHTIRLLSKADPLKYLLDSPSSMRNLAKWHCIGAVLISPDGRYYPVAAKIDFPCTNNVAEYKTLGQWKTKDAKLVPYHEYLEKLTENFEDISFTYIPRMTNQFADALATLASMVSITKENLIKPLEIERAEGPAHCNSVEASEAKPWYEDIMNLLRTGQYPHSPIAAIERLSDASRYTIF
ncbi:hypothetical protein CRG98_015062 [Punica granatum]|uniref:G-patch domain-containing protein n=1 Tax=Punica granatum TaxID=22663 RepID=A0A2I0K7H2_PUNGR|nr:hypothetical protein CRG98_015062 [Punica granatum]